MRAHQLTAGLSSGILLAGLLAPRQALASVPDSYGFGSRSAAMAGAVTADARDFSASYYDPAGLAEAESVSVSVGYMLNVQRLALNGRDNGLDDVQGVVAGLVAPGTVFGIPVAFAVGLHLPDNGLSYLKARREGVPRWELYDARSQLLYLTAAVAIRPFDWLEIGGGIAYLSATRGRFGIRGRADVLSPFESKLEHEVDADLTSVRFPQAGARFIWEGWGALGLTYRGRSNLDLELDARLDGIVDFAGIDVPFLYELEARAIASFTPQQVAIGLSFQRIEDLHLNVDLTWVDWSAYVSPTAEIAANLDIRPPPGTSIDLPASPTPAAPIPPRMVDRLVPRVGIEYRGAGVGPRRHARGEDRPLVQLPLRVGYVYEASPIPDQRGITNLVDADRHTVTLGMGIELNNPIESLGASVLLDGHALFSVFPERLVLKDSPVDFVGDYRARGTIFGGGGTLTVAF